MNTHGTRLDGKAFKAAMQGAKIKPPQDAPSQEHARVVMTTSSRVEAAVSRLSQETLISRGAILEMALAHFIKTKFPHLAETKNNETT